jgi:hypothetical protein
MPACKQSTRVHAQPEHGMQRALAAAYLDAHMAHKHHVDVCNKGIVEGLDGVPVTAHTKSTFQPSVLE